MKGPKSCLCIAAVVCLMTLGLVSLSKAFHSGGVGNCNGCHSMHSSKQSGANLLIGADDSSTCLSCHTQANRATATHHVMTYPVPAVGSAPVMMTPGGDFAWLLKSYIYSVNGTTTAENGHRHGHNVVAADFDITADPDFSTSPGGTFPAGSLGCSSCHDPHGKYRRIGGDTTYTVTTRGAPIIGSGSYSNSPVPKATEAVGSYRLLAGAGYSQNSGKLAINYPGVPVASVVLQ